VPFRFDVRPISQRKPQAPQNSYRPILEKRQRVYATDGELRSWKRFVDIAQNLRRSLGLDGVEPVVKGRSDSVADFVQELADARPILFRQVAHVFAQPGNGAGFPEKFHPDVFERDFAARLLDFTKRSFLQPLEIVVHRKIAL
jgi:hypothetical protein